jgi:hypothetical protein
VQANTRARSKVQGKACGRPHAVQLRGRTAHLPPCHHTYRGRQAQLPPPHQAPCCCWQQGAASSSSSSASKNLCMAVCAWPLRGEESRHNTSRHTMPEGPASSQPPWLKPPSLPQQTTTMLPPCMAPPCIHTVFCCSPTSKGGGPLSTPPQPHLHHQGCRIHLSVVPPWYTHPHTQRLPHTRLSLPPQLCPCLSAKQLLHHPPP